MASLDPAAYGPLPAKMKETASKELGLEVSDLGWFKGMQLQPMGYSMHTLPTDDMVCLSQWVIQTSTVLGAQ